MFRQGVRRILKTPPAETTSAILKSRLRQLHIVLSLTDSFIKDPVIIQVNIKHSNTPYSIFTKLNLGVF